MNIISARLRRADAVRQAQAQAPDRRESPARVRVARTAPTRRQRSGRPPAPAPGPGRAVALDGGDHRLRQVRELLDDFGIVVWLGVRLHVARALRSCRSRRRSCPRRRAGSRDRPFVSRARSGIDVLSSASNTSLESAFSFSGRLSVSIARPRDLHAAPALIVQAPLGSIPPAPAERLKQRRGVRVAVGARLHQRQAPPAGRSARRSTAPPWLIAAERRAAGAQMSNVTARRPLGLDVGLEASASALQCAQRVGHILTREDHGGAVLRARLVERRIGGARAVQQRPGVEQRLGEGGADVPESGVGGEQLADCSARGAESAR